MNQTEVGKLLVGGEQRDAIHVAITPVRAEQTLRAGGCPDYQGQTMNNVICPQCSVAGLKSSLHTQTGPRTAMGIHSYYDTEGKYHCHDGNRSWASYKCSHNHEGRIYYSNKCPHCGYGDEGGIFTDEQMKEKWKRDIGQ